MKYNIGDTVDYLILNSSGVYEQVKGKIIYHGPKTSIIIRNNAELPEVIANTYIIDTKVCLWI
jgi:hypothetical protein